MIGLIIPVIFALCYFWNLYPIVLILLTVVLAYCYKQPWFYKKPIFIFSILIFVAVHNRWVWSIREWVPEGLFVLVLVGLWIYFSVIIWLFFYGLKWIKLMSRYYLLVPLYWVFGELLLASGPLGYPFFSLAVTQAYAPYLFLARTVIGASFISFVMVLMSSILASVANRKIGQKSENKWIFAVAIMGIIILSFGMVEDKIWKQTLDRSVKVALIQPNIPQQEKMNPVLFKQHIQRYVQLLNLVLKENPEVEMILFPETIIPGLWQDQLRWTLLGQSLLNRQALFFGLPTFEDGQYYNSLQMLREGRLSTVYRKQRLVPFGEYIPVIASLYRMSDVNYFSAGPEPDPLAVNSIQLGPLICFESTFTSLVNRQRDKDMLMVFSNDAWFKKIMKEYHLRATLLRVAEVGLSMAFVSNDGPSVMINGAGRIMKRLPSGQTGYIIYDLPVGRPGGSGMSFLRFWSPIWGLLILLGIYFRDAKKGLKPTSSPS